MRSRSLRLDACLRSTRSGVADLGKDMWGFTNVPVRTVAASASALPRSKEEKGQQALLPPAANEQAPGAEPCPS